MAIEFGLTPDTRRDTGLHELVGAAGDAGFTALGMHAWHSDAAAAEALAAGGLRCHEVLPLIPTADEEATLPQAR
ncbi:MAG TPA: hypothetical protein VLH10_04590, partial [Yinghuangia sp.]|nr:hypothetical protein [Yinghuangia sp.]